MTWRVGAVVVLVALAGASAAELPGLVRVLLVLAAFGVGVAFEAMRASGTAGSPLSALSESVGGRTIAAASALAAAAIAILLIPGDEPEPNGTEEASTPPVVDVGSLPDVRTRVGRLGRPLRAAGTTFTVVDASAEDWARDMQEAPAGRGRRWIALAVSATNRSERPLSPAALSYRLADAERDQYYPDRSSGTGPPSLGATGSIGRGQTAEVQLGFRVPTSAAALVLVFEPSEPGSLQVRVPLEET